MRGKQMFHTFKEAAARGAYDEFPMLPPATDPQLHLSRNDLPQPFHLICEKDCVIVQMTGEAEVQFAEGQVRYFSAGPGDFIYVPAGTPHRIVPKGEVIHYRYKAREPGLEGVAFHCDGCAAEISRIIWDTASDVSQSRYADACDAFDRDAAARTCPSCGTVQPPSGFDTARWRAIALELGRDEGEKAS